MAPRTRRVRTVFIGTGPFGVESLRRLAERPSANLVEVVGVVAAPARPAGRQGWIETSPIERAAGELAIPSILTPVRLRDPAAIEAVLGLRPALVVLADYGRIVPRPILDLPLAALNLHPSLLPRHRGATPIPATILAGDRETGVTMIRMDAGIDTGPIVAAARVSLSGSETAPELEARLAMAAADLLERTLGPWIAGTIEPAEQDAGAATLTRLLRREDGRLDPGRSAAELERQVRAYQPWPGAFLETGALRIVVLEARPTTLGVGAPTSSRPVGTLSRAGDGLALTTADGALELLEVQPAGGRPMSGAELLRGRPDLAESTVVRSRPGADDRGPLERPVR